MKWGLLSQITMLISNTDFFLFKINVYDNNWDMSITSKSKWTNFPFKIFLNPLNVFLNSV